MRIGIIQASSQREKNDVLCQCARRAVERNRRDDQVVNYGVFSQESASFSYIETAVNISLLLSSGAVDFIITGCSSGQGMMLACNSFPGVLCGYAPTPADAYLFAQINNGNAVSLPLGEGYTWAGQENLEQTIRRLFSEPFGQGYPKEEASRKLRDTALLKGIRAKSQTGVTAFLDSLDPALCRRIISKRDVTEYILAQGTQEPIAAWIRMQEDRAGKPGSL